MGTCKGGSIVSDFPVFFLLGLQETKKDDFGRDHLWGTQTSGAMMSVAWARCALRRCQGVTARVVFDR